VQDIIECDIDKINSLDEPASEILKDITIILVKTSHPGNIGSTARAMKNMGLRKLILVSPKEFPSDKANALASGARDILDNAKVVDNLDDALKDQNLILATSARVRNLAWPELDPTKASQKAINFLLDRDKDSLIKQKVAVLFGEERIGLENDALACAHYHVIIPTSMSYSSLNLSQAVQVICYQMRMRALASLANSSAISVENDIDKNKKSEVSDDLLADGMQVKRLMDHLDQVMIQTDFIDPKQPKQLRLRLQRLFQRAKLSIREVNILRGICSAVLKKM
jgi:tRNA (cytidine32/uridine32-2'-O)-methyltransferase